MLIKYALVLLDVGARRKCSAAVPRHRHHSTYSQCVVDVVGLVRELAERVEGLPADVPGEVVLTTAHSAFGAMSIAAAVLGGSTSDTATADELAAVALSASAAHARIAEVVGEDLLDASIDARILELTENAANLQRIKASSRWLREAAVYAAHVTHTALTELAESERASPRMRNGAGLAGGIAANIGVLLDGVPADRARLAHKIISKMTADQE
ncbi:hypothetical protein ACWF9G_22995 [Nocardia sp. NPDC055029]